MKEFEYLSQMRALKRDRKPDRDLWTDIASQLTATDTSASPHPAWSIAAAVVLAVTVLFCQYAGQQTQAHSSTASTWKPNDPRLSAAAIDLDAARQELSLALAQNPDGQYLHRLMARTDRQQHRLQQWAQL